MSDLLDIEFRPRADRWRICDLHHRRVLDLGFLRHAPLRDAIKKIVDSIGESLDFFESMSGLRVHAATRVDFYTSHEGCTCCRNRRKPGISNARRSGTTCRLTCPDRHANRQDRAAHVEYFRGIANPIGVKVARP